MKKLAKPLILLLVVSLLAGAFVMGALADTETATPSETPTVVGSYTAPEGAWKPAEGEDVAFATWATEEDYLAGNVDPVKKYDSTYLLDTASITGVGYVHLFKDVTTKTKNDANSTVFPDVAANQQLVINLGGKALTANSGFRVGGASSTALTSAALTMKNGTFNQQSQFHTRVHATVIFDNVVYNLNTSVMAYDAGGYLMEYRNSTLNLHAAAHWDLTAQNVKDSEGNYFANTIRFVNTDVIQTKTPTVPLFRIKTPIGADSESSATIIFDKDSSLTRSNAVPLVKLNSAMSTAQYKDPNADPKVLVDPEDVVYPVFKQTQYLRFEVGCVVSEGLAPTDPYLYQYDYYNGSSGKTAVQVYGEGAKSLETLTSCGAEDTALSVAVVKDGTPVDWVAYDLGDGTVQLLEPAEPWTPGAEHAGITYAVWASESEYLLGFKPDYWYTDADLLTANIGVTDSDGLVYANNYVAGYVHVYANINNSISQIVTGQKQELVINLNGYTLSDVKGFRVGGKSSADCRDASLTIKNGNWNLSSGQLQFRHESSFIMESIVFNVSFKKDADLFYGSAAEYIRFTDCTITSQYGNPFYLAYQNKNWAGARTQFIFENTDLIYLEAPTNSIFWFVEYGGTNVACYDFYFDGKSSIQLPENSSCAWFWLKESAGAVYETGAIKVTFEDGFATTGGTKYPTTYRFSEYDNTAGALKDVVELPVNDDYLKLIYNNDPAALHVHTLADPAVEGRVEPGCGIKGYYDSVVYCTECGDRVSFNKVDIPAIPHTPGDAVIEKLVEGSCTVTGSYDTVVYCTNCKAEISRVTTTSEATGHHWIKDQCTKCGEEATKAWRPDETYAGILYAVWASEDDYINGVTPTYWCGDKDEIKGFQNKYLGSLDTNGTTYNNDFVPGYVHLFGNVDNKTAQIVVGRTQKLVINLNGKTLTDTIGFRTGGSDASFPESHLTIKDGIWNRSSGQLQIRRDTTFIVEKVTCNFSVSTIFNGSGGDYVRFTDCTINCTHATPGKTFQLYTNAQNQGLERGVFIFENTDLIYSSALTAPIFTFINAGGYFDITIDKDSSVIAPSISSWYGSNVQLTKADTGSITFEEGVTLISGTEYPVSDDYVTVNVLGEANYIDYAIEAFKDGTRIAGWLEPHISDGTLSYLPSGTIIKLTQDITAGTIHTYKDYDLTIDLNGYTLTFTTSTNMQFGEGQSSVWSERTIKFTSSNGMGTIDATKRTITAFQARPGTNAVFENVKLILGASGFNDGGANSITFTNCIVTGRSTEYIISCDGLGGGASGKTRTYTFDNTVVEGVALARNVTAIKDVLNINVVNGCVIDNEKPFVVVAPCVRKESLGIDGERIVTLNIDKDTKFTAPNFEFATNENLYGDTLYVSKYPATVNVLDGETPVTGYAIWSEGEYYVFGDKVKVNSGDLKANLTLYTDFNLNFFVNPEVITSVIYNGEALESVPYGDMLKYTLVGIAPNVAADDLKFTVTVKSGEDTCYMSLTYSVLKYANAIEAGAFTTEEKQFINAVMNYVKAAYAYTGNAEPEFVGTEYTIDRVAEAPALPSAIAGASYDLTENFKLRFKLAGDFTGTLKIADYTFEVENGKVGGVDYVTIELRAYELYKGVQVITVTDEGTEVGTYNIGNYLNFANGAESNLKGLIEALYDYSKFAYDYKYAN